MQGVGVVHVGHGVPEGAQIRLRTYQILDPGRPLYCVAAGEWRVAAIPPAGLKALA